MPKQGWLSYEAVVVIASFRVKSGPGGGGEGLFPRADGELQNELERLFGIVAVFTIQEQGQDFLE